MPSRQAQIIARIMKRLNLKKLISSNMADEPKKNFRFEEPPPSFWLKYPVKVYSIDGSKCVYTTSAKQNETPKYHIMYFHGGSYIMPAQLAHWYMVDGILSRVKADLTFVNYPLAPENTCIDTIKMVDQAYKHITEKYSQNIVLMGDSAGGGLALAFTQYLNRKRVKLKPQKLVLLSPWLDIDMENFITKDNEDLDLILDRQTLKQSGKKYAGDMDPKDYLCSPIFGKLKNLPETALFIGTHDVLYAQTEEFKKKMKRAKPPLSYYAYEEMHHVWMGYPIPESREAFDEIGEFLNR